MLFVLFLVSLLLLVYLLVVILWPEKF
ncbi:K(+)-transporting ATPase subunit F [Methylacidiphilum kamchatkense]